MPLVQARLADVRAKKFQPWLNRPGGTPMDSARYQEKILRMFGGAIVGYWPLNDASGTVARDVSGRINNGVYTGLTLGQPGIDSDNLSVYSDGITDVISLTSIVSLWGPNMSVSFWFTTDFSTATSRGLFVARDDTDRNLLQLTKNGVNRLIVAHKLGSIVNTIIYTLTITAPSTTTFSHLCFSWEADTMNNTTRIKNYLNGVIFDNRLSGGYWDRTMRAAYPIASALNNTGANSNLGNLTNLLILNRPITQQEVSEVRRVN